jgi:hypothetical protein
MTKGKAARSDPAAVETLMLGRQRGTFHGSLFPDVPECMAEGESLDQTIFLAASALAESKQAFKGTFPAPRNLTEIKEDNGWASAFGIDWSRAVINMIPLRAG